MNSNGFIALTLVFVTSFSLLLGAVVAVVAVGDYVDVLSRQEYREYAARKKASCMVAKEIHDIHNSWHPFVCEPFSFFVD